MVSVNDLLIILAVFLGSCLVATICVALIVSLVNLISMIKRVNRLIDDNAVHVNKTLKQLPVLVDSLDKAGASIKANADKAGASFGAIESVFTGAPAAAENSNTLMTIVTIAESILKMIIGYFSKKEKE